MAQKIFKYRGMTLEELQKLSVKDFAELIPSRQRRSLLRDQQAEHEKVLKKLEKKDRVKTHSRDMVILPSMVGKTILVYNGKEFVQVTVQDEMIGHFIGEFSFTRKRVSHSAPGIGATKSSAGASVK